MERGRLNRGQHAFKRLSEFFRGVYFYRHTEFLKCVPFSLMIFLFKDRLKKVRLDLTDSINGISPDSL